MTKSKKDQVIMPTLEEDAAITAAAESDPDFPPITDDLLSRLRPAIEVVPQIVEEYRRSRGRQKAAVKAQVTLRLDADLVAHLRRSGKGWQTRVNDILRRESGL